jgi:dihydrofolate reductase
MAKLVYSAFVSLDGYVEDSEGKFDWSEPDEAVHTFVNDRERQVGTYLFGRRMYETMQVWETDPSLAAASPYYKDYAGIFLAVDKVVYSRTLQEPVTSKTRIEREFSPDAVRALKASADRDLAIGGAELAGQAFRAGLVDEFYLLVVPIIVGGGKPGLPAGVRLTFDLLDERCFANGMVHLRYRAQL